ncbi:hypothetical protein HOG48_01490 [Candidatus Peregrinibacteria bacterium]|nr:hypothetical protein [Candidatus Peregrinibacteria bacterium]
MSGDPSTPEVDPLPKGQRPGWVKPDGSPVVEPVGLGGSGPYSFREMTEVAEDQAQPGMELPRLTGMDLVHAMPPSLGARVRERRLAAERVLGASAPQMPKVADARRQPDPVLSLAPINRVPTVSGLEEIPAEPTPTGPSMSMSSRSERTSVPGMSRVEMTEEQRFIRDAIGQALEDLEEFEVPPRDERH